MSVFLFCLSDNKKPHQQEIVFAVRNAATESHKTAIVKEKEKKKDYNKKKASICDTANRGF